MIKTLRWVVFFLFIFLFNFPVIVALLTSLKGPDEITSNPGLWVAHPTLENFRYVFASTDRFNVWSYLSNSLVAASIGALLPLFICFPAAFSITRCGYGRTIITPMVVSLRVIPLVVFAMPVYLMYQPVGLLDTRLGLGLMLALVNLPLTLILSINAIREVPVSIDEAAAIDGASRWRLMCSLLLPLAAPILLSALIFGFITAWNEYLFGLILTTRRAVPMTVGASFFFSSSGGGVEWGNAAAVMLLGIIPPTLLGVILYQKMGRSLVQGAVKG